MIGKYGSSKGWRRERLRTRSGFTVDALGLDKGLRGAKVEDQRPDLIILDDVDEKEDSIETIKKKRERITTSILPAGSNDVAILFIQNLIHPASIASELLGDAEYLADRIISGPFPAVDDLVYERRMDPVLKREVYFITGGTATWEGQDLTVCQQNIRDWGLTAFLAEAQHEVDISGGRWDHISFEHVKYEELKGFVRTVVWVDPAVTSTDDSDSMGISSGGIQEDGIIIMLKQKEFITSPEDALVQAIELGIEINAEHVGVETDQGGDTWSSVYHRAKEKVMEKLKKAYALQNPDVEEKDYPKFIVPGFTWDKAGSGYGSKGERNQRMMTDYENGRVKHLLGTHAVLERSLRRFPKKPLDLADASFWVWNDLKGDTGGFAEYMKKMLAEKAKEKQT